MLNLLHMCKVSDFRASRVVVLVRWTRKMFRIPLKAKMRWKTMTLKNLYHQLLGVGGKIVKNESALSSLSSTTPNSITMSINFNPKLLSTFIQPHFTLENVAAHHIFRNNYDTFASDLMDQVSSEATQSDMRSLRWWCCEICGVIIVPFAAGTRNHEHNLPKQKTHNGFII